MDLTDTDIYTKVGEVPKDVFEMNENKCYSASRPVAGRATTSERKISSATKCYQLTIIVLVVVMMLIFAAASACGAFTVIEILKLKFEIASLRQQPEITATSIQNNDSITIFQELSTLNDKIIQLNRSHDMLYASLTRSGLLALFPAPSCASLPPSSPSGYYWVSGSAVPVYCDMTRSCGNVTGGWMRVADLDMTDSSQQCPSGLRHRTYDDIRTCVRSLDLAGCSSVTLPTSNIHYSRVCGRITAYQFGSTNAFEEDNIDSAYVDGVSLTHGNPRHHIWTFAAALDKEASVLGPFYCPCIDTSHFNAPPAFVEEDYFCDSGQQEHMESQSPLLYSADPLWDGAGCGSVNTCCTFNTPPWFYKQLPDPTTDDIEMRVCRDEGNGSEDIAIQVVEIYVQ